MWKTTTIRVERSEIINGEPCQVWALLSSPAAWSLWPGGAHMFAVPGAETLRFFIGPTPRGTSKVLFEVSDEIPGEMLRLRTMPAGRQEYTLRVAAGKRGTAKATAVVKEVVPRRSEIGFELKRRNDIKAWLSTVRAVIEGRARWPKADMSADLLGACMARILGAEVQSTSAAAMINAGPAAVWDAIQSPETGRNLGHLPSSHCGRVPGTPQGQAGEMQYFVHPHDDGTFTGHVVVVIAMTKQRSALTQGLGTSVEQDYLLTAESESGPTRLELTCRWPAANLAEAAEAARSQMAKALEGQVSGYKTLIENATGSA